MYSKLFNFKFNEEILQEDISNHKEIGREDIGLFFRIFVKIIKYTLKALLTEIIRRRLQEENVRLSRI